MLAAWRPYKILQLKLCTTAINTSNTIRTQTGPTIIQRSGYYSCYCVISIAFNYRSLCDTKRDAIWKCDQKPTWVSIWHGRPWPVIVATQQQVQVLLDRQVLLHYLRRKNIYYSSVVLCFTGLSLSLLGPSMFILYTAELAALASKFGVKLYTAFADDNQLYVHCDISDNFVGQRSGRVHYRDRPMVVSQ